MGLEFLKPLEASLLETFSGFPENALAHKTRFHSLEGGLPEVASKTVVILGVQEGRASVNNEETGQGLDQIRSYLYRLCPGNWTFSLVDLGDVTQGASPKDSYFVVREVVAGLIKGNAIPVLLGGGQDITYANYRAYDLLEQVVNLVSVDAKFDLGNLETPLNSTSYLSKIVMEEPTNLFNFSNVGYQTFFNAQDEIELIDHLSFDAIRLGEAKNLEVVEPIFRDADMVSIDLGAVRKSDAPGNKNAGPNGFYGDEICAISRYAGISDKVTSFGIYEYNPYWDVQGQTAHLIAQMVWYFLEGVSCRAQDYPFCTKENYLKYIVPSKEGTMHFFKSPKSGRWWLEIHNNQDNKYKRHALIPCTHQDYLDAAAQKIPERWFKALKKLT
jgi:arginase family enzyme